MIAPSAVRDVVAVAGALLVLTAAVSVVGTVIIPRKTGSHLTTSSTGSSSWCSG